MLKKSNILLFILLVFIIGFFLSVHLTIHSLIGERIGCPLGGGCDTILVSQLSKVYGVPVALFGVLYFSTCIFLVLSTFNWKMTALSVLGYSYLISAMTLTVLGLFKYSSLCSWCIFTHLCSLVAFVMVSYARDRASEFYYPARWWICTATILILGTTGMVVKERTKSSWKMSDDPVLSSFLAKGEITNRRIVSIFLDFDCGYSFSYLSKLKKPGAIPLNTYVILRPTRPLRSSTIEDVQWLSKRSDFVILFDGQNQNIARHLKVTRLPSGFEVKEGHIKEIGLNVADGKLE